jgi:hypothetical protein
MRCKRHGGGRCLALASRMILQKEGEIGAHGREPLRGGARSNAAGDFGGFAFVPGHRSTLFARRARVKLEASSEARTPGT